MSNDFYQSMIDYSTLENPNMIGIFLDENIVQIRNRFFEVFGKSYELMGISLKTIQFSPKVENSAFSPEDGVVNYERNPELPLWYPGFYVVLELDVLKSHPNAKTDLAFDQNLFGRLHTEYGGLISYDINNPEHFKYRLKCNMFIDDFPLIKQRFDDIVVMNILEQGEKYKYKDILTKF